MQSGISKLRQRLRAAVALLMLLLFTGQALAKDGRNLAVNQVNNAVSEQRIALVIGNGAYTNSPLKNPVNDAKDIAAKLRGLSFNVIERNNLQTKQIGATLREFRSKLAPGAVALVFYAGHGLQIKGINYLPAVDAEINSEEDVPNQSLAVSQIMDVLDEAKTRLNLVFLDACRNNPYARSFRTADKGLARVTAPSGTLISYATRPGSIAADGGGRNGLYTSKLLAQMDSNVQIEQALKRVVTEVKAASQGKQEPWMEGSIEGDFCFAGCAADGGAQVASLAPVPAPARVKTREQIEDEYWEEIKDSSDPASFEQYQKSYPKGRYLNTANLKIAQLKKQAQQPAPVTATPTHDDNESALWNAVEKGNSKGDYDAYLAQYPKGKYVVLAKSSIKKLQDEADAAATRREQDTREAALQQQRQQAEAAETKQKQEAERQRQQAEETQKGYVSQGGLTWMPVTSERTSWAEANSYCANTPIRGQSGWRLPTKDELKALYASGAMKGHGWTLDYTWSSTPNFSGPHYYVNLHSGTRGSYSDTSGCYVTCVR